MKTQETIASLHTIHEIHRYTHQNRKNKQVSIVTTGERKRTYIPSDQSTHVRHTANVMSIACFSHLPISKIQIHSEFCRLEGQETIDRHKTRKISATTTKFHV